jgi:hypothetical protein
MIATRNVNKVSAQMPVANYFSLRVYVLCRMETYTLIRFQSREFVVETQDLVFELGLAQAA